MKSRAGVAVSLVNHPREQAVSEEGEGKNAVLGPSGPLKMCGAGVAVSLVNHTAEQVGIR